MSMSKSMYKSMSMSKVVLSVFVGCMCWSSAVFAITFEDIKYGLTVGANSVKTSATHSQTVTRFNLGAIASVKQTDSFTFSSGLQYTAKGTGTKATSDVVEINYLQVPAIVTYQFPTTSGNVGFHVMGGGYAAYRLSASQGTSDIKRDTAKADAGFIVGIGTTYKDMVSVDLRYEKGFRKVYNDATNQNIQMGLTYIFN